MRLTFAILCCLAAVSVLADEDELALAKAALRDGLWTVARTHAERASGDEAKLVVLESYATEGRWPDVLKCLEKWPAASGRAFDYYRAAASNDFVTATKILSEVFPSGADGRMMEADLKVRAGNRAAARSLWQEVLAMTNASERARVVAAVNLGEVSALEKVCATVRSSHLLRLASLRCGVALLSDAKRMDEGEKVIRSIAKDTPDFPGAREAFVAMAEAELSASHWPRAAQSYHDAIETWPNLVKDGKIHEGLGWALFKLGRYQDALEAFRLAERLATDDQSRALAVLKQGDSLSELGKGEEAMACYRDVLSRYPQTPVAEKLLRIVRLRELESRGREQYRDYRFEEASKTFAEVARQNPSRKARMDFFEVLCQYGRGHDDEAVSRARKLVDGVEDSDVRADAMLWLAKFLYNRGEWKDASELFARYAELKPNDVEAPEALTWAARAAFSQNDFIRAIQIVTRLAGLYPTSPIRFSALLVQGESLIELARFDEAVLVLESVAASEVVPSDERLRAQILKADALYAMGADNPIRYQAALDAYRAVRFSGNLSPSRQLSVSFKIARTLEKLKRMDEAIDQYYTQVVLAYYDGRRKGEKFDDGACADFSRAAFRIAEEYESGGNDQQARSVLEILVGCGVPASEEAARRIERISKKGKFL